jgi:hypothetical protein
LSHEDESIKDFLSKENFQNLIDKLVRKGKFVLTGKKGKVWVESESESDIDNNKEESINETLPDSTYNDTNTIQQDEKDVVDYIRDRRNNQNTLSSTDTPTLDQRERIKIKLLPIAMAYSLPTK